MSTIIIADSRGRGLQTIINNLTNSSDIKILFYPGAGYELATLKAMVQIREMKPILVVMFLGICDITWRNPATKIVGLRHRTVRENVDHVLNAIRSAHDLLRTVGVFNISFATVTGVDMSDCNCPRRKFMDKVQYKSYCGETKVAHPSQTVLNDTIIALNKKIVLYNKANSTQTTWMAGLVHSYFKNKYHHYYNRLRDGCHPDDKTKVAWAAQIVKSTNRLKVRMGITKTEITKTD